MYSILKIIPFPFIYIILWIFRCPIQIFCDPRRFQIQGLKIPKKKNYTLIEFLLLIIYYYFKMTFGDECLILLFKSTIKDKRVQ